MVKWPFSLSTVSSDFGDTKNRPSAHSGVDFAVAAGTPIRAGGPGVVHFAGKLNDRAGNVVSIRYDAFKGTCMHTHVQARYPLPKGRRVNEGDIIAYVGSSGSASGPHLHLEVFADGPRLVNPHSVYKGVVPAGGGGNVILLPTQRRVVSHAFANGRSRPTTKAPLTGEALEPRTVGNFNGWARGQRVDGNDVWFRGISGRWFWSGGFEGGAKTAGLPEVKAPAEPAPVTPDPPSVPSPVEPVDPDPVEPTEPVDPVEPPDDDTPPEKEPVDPPVEKRWTLAHTIVTGIVTGIVAVVVTVLGLLGVLW